MQLEDLQIRVLQDNLSLIWKTSLWTTKKSDANAWNHELGKKLKIYFFQKIRAGQAGQAGQVRFENQIFEVQ